jgi:hypothetical protein
VRISTTHRKMGPRRAIAINDWAPWQLVDLFWRNIFFFSPEWRLSFHQLSVTGVTIQSFFHNFFKPCRCQLPSFGGLEIAGQSRQSSGGISQAIPNSRSRPHGRQPHTHWWNHLPVSLSVSGWHVEPVVDVFTSKPNWVWVLSPSINKCNLVFRRVKYF